MQTPEHSQKENKVAPIPEPKKGISAWTIAGGAVLLAALAFLLLRGFQASAPAAAAIGQPAPAFSLTDTQGQVWDNESLKGKRVILHFWASWCPPCKREIPIVENAWQEWLQAEDVQLIGVAFQDRPEDALAFAQEKKITFPIAVENTSQAAQAYQISGVPASYLIDEEGNLANFQIGPFPNLTSIMIWVQKSSR